MKKIEKRSDNEIIASSMFQIFNYLKSKGELDVQGRGMDFLHLKNYPMDTEQESFRQQMDDVVRKITEKNSQLSEISVYDTLLFDLTESALWFPNDHPNVEQEYLELVSALLGYKATSEIVMPIVNLKVESSIINFGLVSFSMIEESDKHGDFWETVKGRAGQRNIDHIYSFAKITCPGDSQQSVKFAFDAIDRTLNVLRAIGLPVIQKPNSQFWLVNEYSLFQSRTFQSKLIKENYKLKYRPNIATKIGPGLTPCLLKNDILDLIDSQVLDLLQKLMENNFSKPSSEMKKKFFSSLHWLGEATKPDSCEAKFAKLAFSLEALIGGDASDKKGNLSTRGLTATLAERGAFVAESTLTERRKIHDQIYEFYDIRSGIVHGGGKKITDSQLSDFVSLVRKIAWALLKRLDEFKNIDDLQTWILKERYS